MPDNPSPVMTVISALRFRGGCPERLRSLTDSDWMGLCSHGKAFRLMIALRRTCGDNLPEWVREQIDRDLANNAERFERIKVDYSDFAAASRKTGAEHLVIKGFALLPGFIEHPRYRFQGDIDVYCPPASILPAREALYTLGYEPEKGLDFTGADHLASMVRKTDWKWRGNPYDPEMPAGFELHFCFWNESTSRLRPTGLDEFWLRRVESRVDELSFPTLNPVDSLGYSSLNVARDLLHDRASPQHLYELARFLHTNAANDHFWKEWRKTHSDSLRRLEAISFRAAYHHFSCSLPEEVEIAFGSLPVNVKAWFEKFADYSGFEESGPHRAWFWLHLSLLESSAEKRSVLREKLFPNPVRTYPLERIDLEEDISGTGKQGWRLQLWRRVLHLAYVVRQAIHHLRRFPSIFSLGIRFWLSVKTRQIVFKNGMISKHTVDAAKARAAMPDESLTS